jgi:hypothetical protein
LIVINSTANTQKEQNTMKFRKNMIAVLSKILKSSPKPSDVPMFYFDFTLGMSDPTAKSEKDSLLSWTRARKMIPLDDAFWLDWYYGYPLRTINGLLVVEVISAPSERHPVARIASRVVNGVAGAFTAMTFFDR